MHVMLDCMCVTILQYNCANMYVSWCTFFCVYQPAFSAVVHVVTGHGRTWKPVACYVLYSSDNHGLSCSAAHFSWLGGFLPPPVVLNARDGKCHVYFLQEKKDSIKALSFSGAEPDH